MSSSRPGSFEARPQTYSEKNARMNPSGRRLSRRSHSVHGRMVERAVYVASAVANASLAFCTQRIGSIVRLSPLSGTVQIRGSR